MIKSITGTARISTKIIRDGSVSGRDRYCRELEDKLYNRLEKYKHTKFDYIEKNICEILPTKCIQVKKYPKEETKYNGSVFLGQEVINTIPAGIAGYFVLLKANCKKVQFGGVSFETLMHEAHHLFSYFTHPKVPSRIFKSSKISKNENFEQFFVDHFQSFEPSEKCISETKKLLKKYKKDRINLLQLFRYKLMEEIGAYKSGQHYSDKYAASKSIKNYKPSNNMIKFMHLEEKLDIISDLLKKSIDKERAKLKNL